MEIKCQLDATEVFIADLIACSTCFGHHYAHHQEFSTVHSALVSFMQVFDDRFQAESGWNLGVPFGSGKLHEGF